MSNSTMYSTSDAQDSLNLAAAYMSKVTSKTNQLLRRLRNTQIMSLSKLVDAMYSSAKAVLYSALFEGLTSFAMAAGGLDALTDADSAQNGLEELQQGEKTLKDNETALKDKVNNNKLDKGEDIKDVKNQLAETTKKLTAKQKEVKSKSTESTNKSQRANMKSAVYTNASQGLSALPKASQDAIQNQAKAVQTIMEQINSTLSTGYDGGQKSIQSMLFNNIISNIAGINAIQLR